MSIFNKLFGASPSHIWSGSSLPVYPSATEIEIAKQQQAALLADYKKLMQMGASIMSGPAAYKPPPPPKVKHVGGDHPYQMFPERGSTWPSILYKDIIIPHERYQEICGRLTQEEWDAMGLDEKKEYIYLEARKLLITEG